jgi:hypothetical protein
MLYRAVVMGADAGAGRSRAWSLLSRLGVTLAFGLGAWASACGGKAAHQPKAPGTEEIRLEPDRCAPDEVREFRCDALLPRTSALPAPEPYETCPSAIEVRDAVFPPKAGAGRFDARRTERARRRAPPGTQCCYSWCGKVNVVDPAKVVDRCAQPLAFHESYCIAELESGTKGVRAATPYGSCPAAIRPPEATAFSVPNGAWLDTRLTAARRQGNERLCCYGWCSVAPPGTALERTKR